MALQVSTSWRRRLDAEVLLPNAEVFSGGHDPVHGSVSLDGRFLLVANYGASTQTSNTTVASVASFGIGPDCSLTSLDVKIHSGSSVNPERQTAAHAHSVYAFKNGLIYSADLGMDMIFTYNLLADGRLEELARTNTSAGLGPRHIAEHPRLPVMYVICEMGQVILTYRMEQGGALVLMQTSSLLLQGIFRGNGSKAAEIATCQTGRLFTQQIAESRILSPPSALDQPRGS